MTDNNHQKTDLKKALDEDEYSLQEIIFKYLRYWYWFVFAAALFLFGGYLYLRYTTPVYKVSSKILIKDDKGGSGISQQDILSEVDIFNTKNNVDDEAEVLKTRYLMRKVVDELHLNLNYFAIGSIKSTELYNSSPFYVNVISLQDSIPVQQFRLHFSDNLIHVENDSLKADVHYYDTVRTPDITFTIAPRGGYDFKNEQYLFTAATAETVTENYLNNISVEIINKQTNVIQTSLNVTVPKKGEDILNKLYEVYTRINQEDKNRIADSTINFIDGRLAIVAGELTGVEKNIEQFKKSNELSTDIQNQALLAVNNSSDVQKELMQQEVQISVLESIENHLKSNSIRVVPGASAITDPTYISTVEKYNSLVLERDRQLETTKEDNPLIKNLNSQIDNVKNDLLISLTNIKKGMNISKNELEIRNNQFLGQIRNAPTKERAFLDISRQQDVKQQLYLYLLQKREETAISKSGTLANSRFIDPAKSAQDPFTPNKSYIYIYALFAGLLIPAGIIFLKDVLNNKVLNHRDINNGTKVPLIGDLGHNNSGEAIVTKQDSRTAISEQFRAIRTNLQFILKGKKNQVILLTSSMSGEGKSFLSINLALSLAISGKKVAIVELDLRKPKVSKTLGVSGENGFTNYMIEQLRVEQLPQQTALHPNLFIVSSGPIPPNPAELLLQDKVQDLFEYLKKEFEYIIVDTPPVGLVTDGILLAKYADASIYIVRQNFTYKQQLNIINDLYINEKVANISILFNDVKLKGGYGYGYGYGYSYGQNTKGYYLQENSTRSLFKGRKKETD